jgi:maltose-binding protein MalE
MGSVWEAWTNAIVLVAQDGEEPVPAFENAAEQIRTAIEEGG